jgi:hypothetical protein
MRLSRIAFVTVLGSLFFLSSCAKDRDQEQFEREELQRRLNIYDSISGSYEGRSQSRWTGDEAKFRIDLWSETRTTPGAGTRETQERPELLARLYFAAEVQLQMVFRNVSYNEQNGLLTAETKIKRLDGTEEDLKLTATITKSGVRGTLGTLDYFDYGYGFDLQKKSDQSAPFAWPELRRERMIPSTVELEGRGTWGEMENKVCSLSMMMLSGTPEAELLLLLSPIRRLRGSLSFDLRSITLAYSVLIWDSRVGKLTGVGSTLSGGNEITYAMDCIEDRRPDMGRFEMGDLQCTQVISSRGGVAKFKFSGRRP